jgi:hypothetical protein
LAKVKPEDAAKLLAELKAHVRAGVGEEKFNALEAGKWAGDNRQGGGKGKGKGEKKGNGKKEKGMGTKE